MVTFLYTNYEILEKKCKNTITFKLHTKDWGINLTKEVKDLYAENYKTLIKENKENLKNGKIFHASGLEVHH